MTSCSARSPRDCRATSCLTWRLNLCAVNLQDAAKRRVGALVAALRGLRTIQAAMQEFDGEDLDHAMSTSSSNTSLQLSFLASMQLLAPYLAQCLALPCGAIHWCCPTSSLNCLGAHIAATQTVTTLQT